MFNCMSKKAGMFPSTIKANDLFSDILVAVSPVSLQVIVLDSYSNKGDRAGAGTWFCP